MPAVGKDTATSVPGAQHWSPGREGEAKAGCLLLTASHQAAIANSRQDHWGQASLVPSQESVGI
jgi:hypothetical protein